MSKRNLFYTIILCIISLLFSACGISRFGIVSTPIPTTVSTNSPIIAPDITLQASPTVSTTLTPTVKPIVTPTEIPTAIPTESVTAKPTADVTDKGILKGLKICIDPGHQNKGNYEKELCAPWDDTLKSKCTLGTDGMYTGIEEYVTNLQISELIYNKLTALGAEVLMTRTTHDVDISNVERAQMSNEFGADFTLRIHCNSADSSSAEGIDLFVRGEGNSTAEYIAQSEFDYEVATRMLDYICNATGAKKRYVHKSDSYTGINWCKGTCIIIECGFLSNEKEDKLLNSAEYQEKIAQGITDYFVSLR